MFKFIEFLKARPSDKNILIGRIVFGLVVLALLGIHFNDIGFSSELLKSNETGFKYALLVLGIVPVIMGITDVCFAKRKYVRIIQIVLGIIFIIGGNQIVMTTTKTVVKPVVGSGSSINLEDIANTGAQSKPIEVGFWIALLGILPILAGITGKCISKKCYKYGEVIKKIRV